MQGAGNAWVEVSGRVLATDIVYIGWPNGSGINTTHPSIYLDPGEYAFYFSGSGFSSGSKVSILYTYTDNNGDLTQGTAEAYTDSYGNVQSIVSASTLNSPGALAVEVTDENHTQLTATAEVSVSRFLVRGRNQGWGQSSG